ncbi:MAG: hypothetical protein R2681_16990 [Pyrinomonadaceae bacterium]
MNLINDLGNDIAFAVLIEKRYGEKVDSKELLPLISNVRDALKSVSEKEAAHSEISSIAVGSLSLR